MIGVLDKPVAPPVCELAFEELRAPAPELIALLQQTLWGTEEALYRMRNLKETLDHLPDPRYLVLKKNGRLIGARAIVEKRIWFLEKWQTAVYHSFFSVAPREKGRGYGKFLAAEILRRYQPSSRGPRPVYAFIEAGNHRSRHISESLGYRRFRDFHALFFSRFNPRISRRARSAAPEELPALAKRYRDRYAGYSLLEAEPRLRSGDYYVLQDQGEAVAGLQAHLQRWEIAHLGGMSGKIAHQLLPKIAWMRRLFNPADFRFVKFGYLIVKPGKEKALLELMESVLALYGVNTGMIFLDMESPVDRPLLKARSWGLMRSLLDTTVHVMAHRPDFTAEQIAALRNTPVVLSPVDS